jgi:hypothetical protein
VTASYKTEEQNDSQARIGGNSRLRFYQHSSSKQAANFLITNKNKAAMQEEQNMS